MALQRYNHTILKFLDGSVDLSGLKVKLLDSNAAFNAADTTVAAVDNSGAYEVSGNGWTAGGELIASAAWAAYLTTGAFLDGTDISKTATGGSIGPADAALVYYGTLPLFYQQFASSQEAGIGTPFIVQLSANGLVRVVPAA